MACWADCALSVGARQAVRSSLAGLRRLPRITAVVASRTVDANTLEGIRHHSYEGVPVVYGRVGEKE